MRNKSFYICAAIFAALTVIKFTSPEHSERIRTEIINIIDGEDDYHKLITAMGEKIYSGELKDDLVEAFSFSEEGEAETELKPETTPEQNGYARTLVENPEETAVVEEMEELPDNVSSEKPELSFEYCCPVSGTDSSGFGYREHPIDGEYKFHYGTDFAAVSGEEIYSFADGQVYAAGENDSFGKYLIITHGDNCKSLYAHMSSFEITEGSYVKKGELIGRVGQSGNATGPHLHFELMVNGLYVNPELYI